MTVRRVDHGAKALQSRLRAQQTAVEVGIIGAKAGEEKGAGITVSDVAMWAEYGLGQPQRSWLRGWIEENQSELGALMRRESVAIAKGQSTKPRSLARIGLWIQGGIQQRIANGIAPENAPSTIDRKGSSTPLIDTGQLRSSISSRVV
jgi:hypothetical protein